MSAKRKIPYKKSWQDWPQYSDISIHIGVTSYGLPVESVGLLYKILSFIGGQYVDSYAVKQSDPKFVLDKDGLRVAGLTMAKFKSAAQCIQRFFEIDDKTWRLIDNDMLVFTKVGRRVAIPLTIRQQVFVRDGHQCVYCGNCVGPFHLDHVFPFSRGGSDTADNLAVSCQTCNLSKGDKTLEEWRGE
jgi:hypothetical protein